MFFRNSYEDRYPQDTTVNVTEKRAPTDESVRLLKEMEEAARNKVIETIVVADTSFTCKISKEISMLNYQDVYTVVYSLGGRKKVTQAKVERHQELKPHEIAIIIRDAVAVDISNHLIATAFQNGFK